MHGILLRSEEAAAENTDMTESSGESGFWAFFDKQPKKEFSTTLSWVLGIIGFLMASGNSYSSYSLGYYALSYGGIGYVFLGIGWATYLIAFRQWWALITSFLNQDAWHFFYLWRWSLIAVMAGVVTSVMWAIVSLVWGWGLSYVITSSGGLFGLVVGYFLMS